MTQNEVLRHLVENTHVFFKPEFADEINKAFGTKLEAWTYRANPEDPKGLTLDDGAKAAKGISALDAALALCGEFGLKYDEKFGRGSQVRACVEALRAAGYGND